MIPVTSKPEPHDFDTKVRQPGLAFLAQTPNPTNAQWRDFWSKALDQLFTAYARTCAYSASPVRRGTAKASLRDRSLDHYVARVTNPLLAYEWTNFRLCRSRLNTNKGHHADVLDPFTLSQNRFALNFLTFDLVPDASLDLTEQAQVQATIARLKLNDDKDYWKERSGVVKEYCLGRVKFTQIQRHYPFIALEMQRQNFDHSFLPQMQARLKAGLPGQR